MRPSRLATREGRMRQARRRRGVCAGPAETRGGRERGFTLIETSIALLIIMVALLGLSSIFVYGINYNAGAQVRTVAMVVAQQRMEMLRGAAFQEVASSSEPGVTSGNYTFAVNTTVAASGNLL